MKLEKNQSRKQKGNLHNTYKQRKYNRQVKYPEEILKISSLWILFQLIIFNKDLISIIFAEIFFHSIE